ncbi:hypothetical protein, partial [Salmonella sp. s55004]|uniref:hypothetical protein n=1 Tax=Salmonella sp. s55004 TaxID=3159675 RepID=UPI003980D6BB
TIVDAGFNANFSYSGSAVNGGDYTAPMTVEIPISNSSTVFEITITNDTIVEDCEDIVIELLSVNHTGPFRNRTSGAVVINPASSTQILKIIDDDTATVALESHANVTEDV